MSENIYTDAIERDLSLLTPPKTTALPFGDKYWQNV